MRVHDQTPQRAAIQPSPAQLIEIPNASKAAHRQPLPATIFVLMNGEKLEAEGYLLTASSLSATLQHSQRTIPLEMLDLQATLTANRERGLDLRIPAESKRSFRTILNRHKALSSPLLLAMN